MHSKTTPKISIITAVFNGAETLRATIDSITQQLNNEVEYIIIDGDSTDNSKKIISEYTSHLAYWVSEPDEGIYDAWNKGLTHASGQYICFIGADDILLPGSIDAYLTHIKQHPGVEYLSSQAAFGKISGRKIGQLWRWNRFRHYMTVAHVGSLHHRSLYDRFGFYDTSYKIAGDYEFLLRAGASLKAGFLNKVTVIMGDNGISNASAARAIAETKRAKHHQKSTSALIIEVDYYIAIVKKTINNLAS